MYQIDPRRTCAALGLLAVLAACASPPPAPLAAGPSGLSDAGANPFAGRWTAESEPEDATGSNRFASWTMEMQVGGDGRYRARAICSTAHPVTFAGTVDLEGNVSASVSSEINMAKRRLTGRMPVVEIGAWGVGFARCGQAEFRLTRAGGGAGGGA